MAFELFILLGGLLVSLVLRPWRLLNSGALVSPLLGSLVILPWLWALPRLHTMPLQLQFSGACVVTLMLGWPLAIPVLTAIALLSGLLAPADWSVLLGQVVWLGIVPATLVLCSAAGVALIHLSSFLAGRSPALPFALFQPRVCRSWLATSLHRWRRVWPWSHAG